MKGYKHFSLEERELLFAFKEQKLPLRTIAGKLNRSHATISRELRRNVRPNGYYIPCSAHTYAYERLHKQRSEAALKSQAIYDYVVKYLKKKWSPETIAGRLPIDQPGMSIHHETIYRYIYWRGLGLHLWNYLTLKRKRRMKKGGRKVRHSKTIPDGISIDLRPQEAQGRTIAGHWETDNLIGRIRDKTAVSTTVERVTRYTILSKLKGKTAKAKQAALTTRLLFFPDKVRKTLTSDNGVENVNHKHVSTLLRLAMYFCHAYASWEKGTVENTNGRIRRYIPKGKSIDILSEEAIARVEYQLNHTPRKCLGYLTPTEAMEKALKGEMQSLDEKRKIYEQASWWLNLYPL